MFHRYIHILPLLISVWFPITFVITYIVSVSNEDVTPLFPFISDTGNWSPESCFFSMMLNLGALMLIVFFYINYMQKTEILKRNDCKPILTHLNHIGFVCGLLCALGVSIVGNFQETNVFVVHILGAVLAFGMGLVYQCFLSYIAFQTLRKLDSRTLSIARIVLTLINCLSYWVTFICASLALMQFTGKDMTKWTKDDGGYVLHFVSAIFEWFMCLTMMAFIGLYYWEFKQITIIQPVVEVKV